MRWRAWFAGDRMSRHIYRGGTSFRFNADYGKIKDRYVSSDEVRRPPLGFRLARKVDVLSQLTIAPGSCEDVHSVMPSDYLGWHEEADRRVAAKEIQKQCPHCGLWMVWESVRRKDD